MKILTYKGRNYSKNNMRYLALRFRFAQPHEQELIREMIATFVVNVLYADKTDEEMLDTANAAQDIFDNSDYSA